AVQLALLVEEGLMAEDHRIGDFMVRDIAVAHPWQPVSSVRQAMLVNSFTFLPTPVTTLGAPAWHLISDYQLARFLRPNDSSGHEDRHERSRRLSMSIETAIREAGLMVDK